MGKMGIKHMRELFEVTSCSKTWSIQYEENEIECLMAPHTSSLKTKAHDIFLIFKSFFNHTIYNENINNALTLGFPCRFVPWVVKAKSIDIYPTNLFIYVRT